MLDAIDLGAEDVNISESTVEIISEISDLETNKINLENKNHLKKYD